MTRVSSSTQEITKNDYTWLSRLLRSHARRQVVTREVTVTRADTRTGRTRTRKVRRRVARFAGGGRSGFLSVNNGPTLTADLSRALAKLRGICAVADSW